MMQQVSGENWSETATAGRNQIVSPGVQVHHKDFYQCKEITTLCGLKQSGGNGDQCELSHPLNTFSMPRNATATLCESSFYGYPVHIIPSEDITIINGRNHWIA